MKIIKFQFLIALVSIFFMACNTDKKLPIYGEREVAISKDANGNQQIDTIYKTIPDFSFLNQDSVIITQDDFKGKIYVADFFFTSCTTICPTMHRNMKTVYEEFKSNPDIMFLSHTIDFKYDTPSVLKRYAEKLGVNDKRWQFAYGNKEQIYSLAEKNYLTVVEEDSTARDGYIHQGWFVLIDKHKRMRGAYDGTKTEQVDQLKKDLVILLAEEKD